MKRPTHDEHQTRQVAPAPPGWRAVYALDPDDPESKEPYCFDSVVAFGEVWRKRWICDERGRHVDVAHGWRHDGWEALVLDGETGALDRASAISNFIGVVGPGDEPADLAWMVEARDDFLARRPQGQVPA